MTAPLIQHIEQHLGRIEGGWSKDAHGQALPVQVVLLGKSPVAGAKVLCTLGLSNVALGVGDGARRLREELVVMFREEDGERNLPAVLQQLAMEALSRDRAYSVGDVIGPRDELRTGSALSAFYVALPVYMPDSFQVCRTAPEPIVFGWLVPITRSEAKFIEARGADAFEDLLEAAEPDLLDFGRSGIA